MMPILRIADVQNFKPGWMLAGSLIVFAMSIPSTIAIMIALTGLFEKPRIDTPNQSAT